jgi:outer membrane murein-binding lipoprotein Lpp
MSYPGDPAAGQPPQQYPYSDGSGYPPPNQGGYQQQPSPGGYMPPQQPGPIGAPDSAPPFVPQPTSTPAYGQDPNAGFGGYYDPNAQASAPPSSGMPYSGPPMAVQPVSGPVAGAPLGPSQPGQRKSPATAIFASLMVLFLLATAVLAVLYGTRTGDYNDEKKTVAARDTEITGLKADVEKLKADVKRVEGERDTAKRDLGGAQGQADELKRQKQVISNCINLLVEAGQAESAGNAALAQQKNAEADKVCDEAFRYLD